MRAYYGSRISDHLIKTPEGFLICKDVPIARIGTQEYRGMEFGGEDPEKIYNVNRPEDEVFTPAAMASFEGKPVVDEHPSEDVTPDNVAKYIKGICKGVHRGAGELSDCLVADLLIYDNELIKKIENGKRDISCGYDCLWVPDETDDSYTQREIRGNHVAVVDRGRAGHKVSIRDSKGGTKTMKDKHSIWGRMLKAFATDSETTPEDIEQASKLKPTSDDDEERPVPQQAPQTPHSDLEDRMSKVEDALDSITSMLESQLSENKAHDDEEGTGEVPQQGTQPKPETSALDDLEKELTNQQGAQQAPAQVPQQEQGTDEDTVEVDPKRINTQQGANDDDEVIQPGESDEEEQKKARDAALRCIDAIRPVVAKIPSTTQRKRAADALAGLIRGQVQDSGYNLIMQASRNNRRKLSAHDSALMDNEHLGEMIRDKFNSNYRK